MFVIILKWKYYKKYKNKNALDTLLAYNIEDVLSLESLMIKAYNLKVKELAIKQEALPIPERSINLFKPNNQIVSRVKAGFEKYGITYLEKKQVKISAMPNPILKSKKLIKSKLQNPSKELSDRWLYAKSKKNNYPEMSTHGGKILIFISQSRINKVWSIIRKNTEQGKLTRYAKSLYFTSKNLLK